MALPDTSIAMACRAVAELVRERFRSLGHSIRVPIGTPAAAVPATADTDHRVNLFFHRFEPAGFDPDGGSGETLFLRVHCLVTAFGAQEGSVSPGESDLRLIGEVIRLFHEKPVMEAVNAEGEVVRIQVVFQPLSPDDINRLWSTQKDVAYRPSVAYELALVPVVPRTRSTGSPLVSSIAQEIRAGTGDARHEDWAPRLCFVRNGESHQSLSFPLGSEELTGFEPGVLIAGEVGEEVTLRWMVWDRETGWREEGPTATVTIPVSHIDPEHLPVESVVSLPLPFKEHAGQAVLYAVRRYRRAVDGEGGAELEVRSNPLLVTLHGGGA
jgi:hypothetical protein